MVEEVVLELVFNMEGILVAVVDSAVVDVVFSNWRRKLSVEASRDIGCLSRCGHQSLQPLRISSFLFQGQTRMCQ